MNTVILRRRKLGRTSAREISNFSTTGIEHKRNWVAREQQSINDADIIIRWGCVSNVNTNRVLNTAAAIHQVNDKAGFRRLLNEAELCPVTYFGGELTESYSDSDVYPLVVRPSQHSRGRNLWVVNNLRELITTVAYYNLGTNWYASELINKVAEYRVFVVQGRAVAVAQKTPGNPDDVAWNVARGGRFDNVRWDAWPLQAVRKSIEAFNLSDLDFGGVDVMVDSDGNSYIIEINSAPSLTSPYRQEAMAKAFDYIINDYRESREWAEAKLRFPLIEERGGYRKFIHPAVCDRALIV